MNNSVGEKYLPLGTVVMLKGASKRLMITGFCTMAAEEENGAMYDYSGCMYPEGFISSDQTALFNHDQIETVYHMGLVDDEEKTFKASLNQIVAQMNGGVASAPVPAAEPIQPVVQPVTTVVEEPVPPIGPGLPGYVAPTPVVPTSPQPSNEYQFDANENVVAAPAVAPVQQPATPTEPSMSNIQFDENGTVISA